MVQYFLSVLRLQYKWLIGLLLVACTAYAAFIPGSLQVENNITLGGTVDGRDISADLDQAVKTTDTVAFGQLTVDNLTLNGATISSDAGMILNPTTVLLIQDGTEGTADECLLSVGTSGQVKWDTCPTGDLESTSSSVVHALSAFIDGTGTPSVTRQDGTWIGSITDNSTGNYDINTTGTPFSGGAPNCVCSANAGRICSIDDDATGTVINVSISSDAGVAEDRLFFIICFGLK